MRVGRQKPTAVLVGAGPAISNAAVRQWLLQMERWKWVWVQRKFFWKTHSNFTLP
ncbi:hypothetical protein T06_5980 [Trichinella sp. T6]|nr:hypothetical protein T06_5980 [Trichinella sp. T6]